MQHVNFPHHMHNPSHELAQHYVHPQIMYHQYLRAHQEALTAHIPRYLPQGELKLDLDRLVILTKLKNVFFFLKDECILMKGGKLLTLNSQVLFQNDYFSLQIICLLSCLKKCVLSNSSVALHTTKQCRRFILLDGIGTFTIFSLFCYAY